MSVKRYWQLDYPQADGEGAWTDRTKASLAEELRALLFDATRIRLRSDVPVGAYLSGGLDSSIITAAVKQITPDTLRTFLVTFESAEFDERDEQQEMIAALDTRHEELRCTATDIGRIFSDVVRHTETPVLRTAPAPLFALSGLVNRAGFKVVLTGEGADEVFAGYDIFKEAKLRRFCAGQPDSQRRTLLYRRLYPYLPQLQTQSQSSLAAFFSAGGNRLDDPLYFHLPRFRATSGTKLFLSRELQADLGGYDALADLRDSLPADFGRWHPLSQAQYLESAHLLPGYILSSQGDRMSMAYSVEGRYPFLDTSAGGVCRAHSAAHEAAGNARKTHPARKREGPASADHLEPAETAVQGTRQPEFRRPGCAGFRRRATIAAMRRGCRLFRSGCGTKVARQMPQATHGRNA